MQNDTRIPMMRRVILPKIGIAVSISILIIFGTAAAGPLTPSANPTATGYTLSDIYTRITTAGAASSHAFVPSASPASSSYTLTDVYNAIPTVASGDVKSGETLAGATGAYPSSDHPLPNAGVGIADLAATSSSITSSNGDVEWWQSDGTYASATLDFPALSNVCSSDTSNNSAGTLTVSASTISVSATYCGTAGTLLANMFNGTSGAYTGGSQADGGADDYNNGGAAPGDRYETTWTACTVGNSYCGTSDSGADARDEATGLIWSMPCNGSGCSSFSDSSPITYTWNNTGGNNSSKTAYQLCSGHSGWSLPHQKQYMQAYIDGSYDNLEAAGTSRAYWTATTVSNATTYAWYAYLSNGLANGNGKGTATYVRCVR